MKPSYILELAHRRANGVQETADAAIFISEVAKDKSHRKIITLNCFIRQDIRLHLHLLSVHCGPLPHPSRAPHIPCEE